MRVEWDKDGNTFMDGKPSTFGQGKISYKEKPRMIEWAKRCTKRETSVSTISTWKSKCGRYQVDRSVYKANLPDKFRAYEIVEGMLRLISDHRKLKPAYKACHKRHQ